MMIERYYTQKFLSLSLSLSLSRSRSLFLSPSLPPALILSRSLSRSLFLALCLSLTHSPSFSLFFLSLWNMFALVHTHTHSTTLTHTRALAHPNSSHICTNIFANAAQIRQALTSTGADESLFGSCHSTAITAAV